MYGKRIGMDISNAILHQSTQARVLKGVKNIVKPMTDLVIGLLLNTNVVPSLNKSVMLWTIHIFMTRTLPKSPVN